MAQYLFNGVLLMNFGINPRGKKEVPNYLDHKKVKIRLSVHLFKVDVVAPPKNL